MENYETLGTIGEGTYGVVLKARHKETGQIVAIKKFKESDEDEQVRKTALREVRILKQLKHDNIVNLIEVFRRKSKLHLVFEYVERTILEDLERNPDGMDPIETKKCLWQLLRSIDYCHAHNIIHRDIKPENLLVSRNGVLKLCDFGFARTLAGPGARYTDYVATRWYRGPELLTGDTQYGKPVDIWAIGCMLPEMASGAPLFPGESDIDQLFHIMRCFGQLPPKLFEVFRANPLFIGIKIPDNIQQTESLEERFPNYPREQLELMKDCLRYEPDHRSSCEELMAHRYFNEDGFISWFDEELKRMLESDAQDFKMRQKKFRKSKGRGADLRAPPEPERPQSQPPAAVTPSLGLGKSVAPPPPAVPQADTWDKSGGGDYPTGGFEPDTLHAFAPLNTMPAGRDTYASHTGSGDLGPPPLDMPGGDARRPATRGSECGGGSSAAEFGAAVDEMPLLPNLQRPTTPRAQRLVAFPQLASALEDGPSNSMSMGHTSHAVGSTWGGGGSSLGHTGSRNPQYGGAPQIPLGKSNKSRADETPSMPSLSQAQAPAPGRHNEAGNLPQLKEGQLFAAELPYPGANMAPHGPPPSRGGGGGGKKKASAYDPSNPYAPNKPSGKSKTKSSKSSTTWGSSSGVGAASSSGMQAGDLRFSVQGTQGGYGGVSQYGPPHHPVGGSHQSHFGGGSHHGYAPPRTPSQDSHDMRGGGDDGGFAAQQHGGFSGSFAQGSSRGHYSNTNYNLQGGQYAKYGKRY